MTLERTSAITREEFLKRANAALTDTGFDPIIKWDHATDECCIEGRWEYTMRHLEAIYKASVIATGESGVEGDDEEMPEFDQWLRDLSAELPPRVVFLDDDYRDVRPLPWEAR